VWSWAASTREVAERVAHARRLVGQQLSAVRYVDIDYRRDTFAPDSVGPRQITDPAEWQEPTWRYPGFDSLDFGIELVTATGRTFSVTWDPTGTREGIGLREQPLIGSAVCVDADVAIWEVGAHSRWAPVLGTEVADVVVGYEPDDAGGLWCPCIRVTFRTAPIDLILGDVQPDQQLSPSADNIAVLFNAR
jgi:hypothetical protein